MEINEGLGDEPARLEVGKGDQTYFESRANGFPSISRVQLLKEGS